MPEGWIFSASVDFLKDQVKTLAEAVPGYDAMTDDWKSTLQAPLVEFALYLPLLCERKRVMLLLDGLNEIPTQHRKALAGELGDWLERLPPQLPVYVACRRDDYSASTKLPLDELSIQSLTVSRIQAAIRTIYTARAAIMGINDPESRDRGLFQMLLGEEWPEAIFELAAKWRDELEP